MLVHPVSWRVVDVLVRTPMSPNQVSVVSVFAAAAGAWCYMKLSWPLGAVCGVAFQFLWHVLDGADGDLARRTGRASPIGELVDGVCDHASQVIVYLAFVAIMLRTFPAAQAWWVASIAGASHFIQANAYETGRKTYRRWVYGAAWMRQTAGTARGIQAALAGIYMGLSRLMAPGETALEAVMVPAMTAGGETAERARLIYSRHFAPLVKRSAILSGNSRTMAAFVAMLSAGLFAGGPLWFFLFEISVLNLALAVMVISRARLNRAVAAEIQAASAPN